MRTSLIILLLSFLIFKSPAQTLQQKLEKSYTEFEQSEQLKYASTSFTVLNTLTGEVIFSRNGNMGLAPGSTLKVITSATAYHLLGKDFTWQTSLGYNETISADGVLNGDLILTGGGDPTLGSSRFTQSNESVILKKWIDAIKKAGIKKINGRLIGDDSLYDTQSVPIGWIWQDIGNYFGAGPNALTWRENSFELHFSPGNEVGDPAKLQKTKPALSFLKIVNEVKTGKAGSGDNVYAYSAPYSNIIYLRGTYAIDLQKIIEASVPDPAFALVCLLQDTLKKAGVQILQPVTTARLLKADNINYQKPNKEIYNSTSPSLDEVIYWFNQKSVNLFGEHLVKTLALKQGTEVSTEAGINVIKNFWQNQLNIDPKSMNILDGSGLSPGTRVTTLTMSKILQSVKKEPWFSGYYNSFPVYNDMKMKSGTINDCVAYAGYQTTSSGVPLVFAIIINNYTGGTKAIRQKMFSVLDLLK
ncbi:MAG: D-alanyl-D-alanine carboxypeptidase/D-alanyl-D-alanine-endopeptidase [Daejeonella sp.]|nr:D-alanyl-D-alanine carboxypeptidase/D-alanyl-D-alanine-endopeptidase [Daejeonella sp.]